MPVPKSHVAIVLSLILFVSLFSVDVAYGDILLYDIDANESAWIAAKSGLVDAGSWDLDDLPDFGTNSADGPIGSGGGGLIPAGFLPDNVSLNTRFALPSNIFLMGPSNVIWNPPSNATMSNSAFDQFEVDFFTPVTAFEFVAISTGGTVTVTVIDDLAVSHAFSGLDAPIAGHRYV